MPLKRNPKGELLEVACLEDNQDLLHLKGREGAGASSDENRGRDRRESALGFDRLGPSFLYRGVRHQQTSEADRHHHDGAVVEPARLDSTIDVKATTERSRTGGSRPLPQMRLYRRGTRPEDFPVRLLPSVHCLDTSRATARPTARPADTLMFADGSVAVHHWRGAQVAGVQNSEVKGGPSSRAEVELLGPSRGAPSFFQSLPCRVDVLPRPVNCSVNVCCAWQSRLRGACKTQSSSSGG
jgi:hypothetical protein